MIYKPARVDKFEPFAAHADYYLIASRLVGYKRIDLAVEALTANGRRLIVVIDYMKNALTFVCPGLEDFGIAAVEANASGKPVLTFGGGGAIAVRA